MIEDDDDDGYTNGVRVGATKTQYVLEQESKENRANTKRLLFRIIYLNLNQAKRYYNHLRVKVNVHCWECLNNFSKTV